MEISEEVQKFVKLEKNIEFMFELFNARLQIFSATRLSPIMSKMLFSSIQIDNFDAFHKKISIKLRIRD
ncbi:hypothetical protein BpHYR1_017245 [Brachionus plicatilis]|uniref:Uncharacterized protein n=1 Tax=Brachionus plicatilis TaxID=10195 RepID=A0A3M7SPC0_BRAPC|nr:hypothetical protein BpHYR1_017245 [Brachionus plicatilis]